MDEGFQGEDRIGPLLKEIGEADALEGATRLLGAAFHGIDRHTFHMRLSELVSRLVLVSLHPDGTFCTGVVLPLLHAAAIAGAMISEAEGMGTDPMGETVTPRYIAEMIAERLAAKDAEWDSVKNGAEMIRAYAMGEDDAPDAQAFNEAQRSFNEEYRNLTDGADDTAEDEAVKRDAENIAALNALLGLDYKGPMS